MSNHNLSPSENTLLIFLPTYNERNNVTDMVRRINALNISADILFIDDNSPDGTGKVLDALSQHDPGVAVIHRQSRSGIGSGHREAIQLACRKGYKYLITMDADLTHAPEDIPAFLAHAENADVVVGSRFLSGSIDRRGICQRLASRLTHRMTTLVLGLSLDVTNAFRLYRLDKLDDAIFSSLESQDYDFFLESISMLKNNGVIIAETPVRLSRRRSGKSKVRFRDTLGWLAGIFSLRYAKRPVHEKSL